MHRLKKAWNYWMDLDTTAWIDHIPTTITIALLGVGYVLVITWLFWMGYRSLDFRHSIVGKNYHYEEDWERILGGCLWLGLGSVLVVVGIGLVWWIWRVRPLKTVPAPKKRVKKPYRRGNNRFKPTNRRHRQ